jgi:hypothetical protein
MNSTKATSSLLKLELLSCGVDFQTQPSSIGEHYKEEYRAIFDARLQNSKNINLPPEIVLPGSIVVKTIYRETSPYSIVESGGDFYMMRKSDYSVVCSVNFPLRPDFYRMQTSKGTPMKQIGQILGLDCLGVIINSYCSRCSTGKGCKFCNIASTTQKDRDSIRGLDEIVETAMAAQAEGAFSLVNLTGGTFEDPGVEFETYTEVGGRLRNLLGSNRLPGVSSVNPPTADLLARHTSKLANANFDLLTYNLEVWDRDILREVCPGKHDIGGRDFYIDSAIKTMGIIGEGHVGIIFTVGPWESVESLIEGCEHLARKSILPIPVVFHPGRGAEYSYMGTTSVNNLLRLYQKVGEIYRTYGLVRDGRCRPAGSELSFRNSLINETVLGHLK